MRESLMRLAPGLMSDQREEDEEGDGEATHIMKLLLVTDRECDSRKKPDSERKSSCCSPVTSGDFSG